MMLRYFSYFVSSYCNDLFSRFEQQIVILEKLAGTTDGMTDRRGHDGPSWVFRSMTLRVLKLGTEKSTLCKLWRTCRTFRHIHDEPWWVSVAKHFNFWEFGPRNEFLTVRTDVQDGPSQVWRTVTVSVVKRGALMPYDDLCDGPSQARRPVTGCTIPGSLGFLHTF